MTRKMTKIWKDETTNTNKQRTNMRITQEQQNAFESKWDDGNNAGNGYPVGDEGESINEISELGALVLESSTDTQIAVYRTSQGEFVGVGDANGMWAVDLHETTRG